MPNGTNVTAFDFPVNSRGALKVWEAEGGIRSFTSFGSGTSIGRGWNGSPGSLTDGDRNLPATWPGRNYILDYFRVFPVGAGFSASLAFLGSDLETQQVQDRIAHYWFVYEVPDGAVRRAFQYRIGSAAYAEIGPTFRRGIQVFGTTRSQIPAFTWPGVDPRMHAGSGTFKMALYAGTVGIEPLFSNAVEVEMMIGSETAPDLAFPVPPDLGEMVTLYNFQPAELRIMDSALPPQEFVTGLRETGERLIEFPAAFIQGVQRLNVRHERRVDNIDSTDNSFRTRYIHPGHRTMIDLGMRFRSEEEFNRFAGIVSPGGEALTIRLALSELQGVVPLGGSDSRSISIAARAETGAHVLHIASMRRPLDPPALPVGDMVGETFVNGATTHTIRAVSGDAITFTPALTAEITAGQERSGTAGTLRFNTRGAVGATVLNVRRVALTDLFPPTLRAGQVIQPAARRKLYTIQAVDATAGTIIIEPGLVAALPQNAQIRTGENVLYYMQPQGTLGWSKDRSINQLISASWALREVL